MSNIIRFPAGQPGPANRIPRERFAALAELALDVVDQILAILDEADREPVPAVSGDRCGFWVAPGEGDLEK
jgi:hypothetical protein